MNAPIHRLHSALPASAHDDVVAFPACGLQDIIAFRISLPRSARPVLQGERKQVTVLFADVLRLATRHCSGLPQGAGDAAIAVGEEWPPAEACGRSDGAQKAIILPRPR